MKFRHTWRDASVVSRYVKMKILENALKKIIRRVTFVKLSLILLLELDSNHQRCYIKKGVFKNFVKFTGKHLCQSIFFIKLQTYGLKQTTAYGIKIVLIGN